MNAVICGALQCSSATETMTKEARPRAQFILAPAQFLGGQGQCLCDIFSDPLRSRRALIVPVAGIIDKKLGVLLGSIVAHPRCPITRECAIASAD